MSAPYDPTAQISKDLKLPPAGVAAVVALLAEGNTTPFIARYRKEVTGGLDEVQIRNIETRREYLNDLEARRQTVLSTIEGQGKLTGALAAKIKACTSKTVLEDLYLPYKPKRRTKATIARERGLAPLATAIMAQDRRADPRAVAQRYVDPGKEVPDVDAALLGASHIVAESISEQAEVRATVRDTFRRQGQLTSQPSREYKTGAKKDERTRFEQYYDFTEPVRLIPSHRYLAVRRGENDGVLKVGVAIDADPLLARLDRQIGVDTRAPFGEHYARAVRDAYKRLLAPSVETDVRVDLKRFADEDAVDVFARNLRDLLLAAPLGGKRVVAIDPGLRTGSKCVALDATGRFLANITIYPARGGDAKARAGQELLSFVRTHRAEAVAVGNGTGGRETEALARETFKAAGLDDVVVIQVNESGASIYSASDIAREEFPDLDLTIRGAISIGRRLQDPLAELVKLDPKSIGVGQYQHDVQQTLLKRKLGEVVESCVNHVGVELNTASAPLLARVAGLRGAVAKNIIAHREANGAFTTRKALLKVKGLGPKAFEQCAGFLRIAGAKHPLDASAVHPERYALVERIAKDLNVRLAQLVGDAEMVERIDLKRYVDDTVGMPTLLDIIMELKKPGRDPRQAFEPPKFRDDVNTMDDLEVGMELEGVVTNVTAFGAFVDVGVHQDGLVHVSQISDKFINDPAEVVSTGDRIKVRVLEVDLARKRISLSAKSEPVDGQPGDESQGGTRRDHRAHQRSEGSGRQKPNRKGGQKGGQQHSGQKGGFSHNPFAGLLKR